MKINRFMANIDNMARQNMFEVDIYCPNIDLRLRGIRCQKAVLPGKTFEVAPFNEISSGPNRSYITGVKFTQDIALTFICDNHFEDKMKLELWQQYMYADDYSMRYPKDFYGNVIIRQMDRGDDPIYEVELHETFPQVIAAQTLDMTSSAVQTFDVTFGYRTWVSSFEYPPENSILGAIFKRNKRRIISKVRRKLEDIGFREDGKLLGLERDELQALILGGNNLFHTAKAKALEGKMSDMTRAMSQGKVDKAINEKLKSPWKE